MSEVLVFVPGILGSELLDDQGLVWPGGVKDGIFKFSDARFERLKASDLRVGNVIRKAAAVVDIYGSWLRTFAALRSRETGRPMFSEDGDTPTLVTVPYDWRKSIESAAEVLADAVESVAGLHGPKATIHLAAHSMGGLVSRYLLQSRRFDARKGFDQISTLLTFGTPHKGSCMAVAAATGLDSAQFLSVAQTKELANDPRYPSLYQLFPHEGASVIWDDAPGGRLTPKDVFTDRALACRLGLNEAHLDRAAELQRVLRSPRREVRHFMFVGSRYRTVTHFLYDGRSLRPVSTDAAGDGTVPLQGSMLEDCEIRFTDRNHVNLIDADETRHTLQTFFHADGLLSVPGRTELVLEVAKVVFDHREDVEVALFFKTLDREVDGTLYLERARLLPDAVDVEDGDFDILHPVHVSDLRYDGPSLSWLHVRLQEVTGPAVYRPVFTLAQDSRRFVGPSFVVQRPE